MAFISENATQSLYLEFIYRMLGFVVGRARMYDTNCGEGKGSERNLVFTKGAKRISPIKVVSSI